MFYYTYSDTYISSVRTALDAQLDALGVTYQDFDSNGNQTTQNEAIQTAIADGYNLLIVNMVTSGSSDTAKGIMELAGDVPVIFFNRAVDEEMCIRDSRYPARPRHAPSPVRHSGPAAAVGVGGQKMPVTAG